MEQLITSAKPLCVVALALILLIAKLLEESFPTLSKVAEAIFGVAMIIVAFYPIPQSLSLREIGTTDLIVRVIIALAVFIFLGFYLRGIIISQRDQSALLPALFDIAWTKESFTADDILRSFDTPDRGIICPLKLPEKLLRSLEREGLICEEEETHSQEI